MTKYEGIIQAEAALQPSEEIKPAPKKEEGGYFAGLIARLFIAAVLLGAVFLFKNAEFQYSGKVTESVNAAVAYDVFGRQNDGTYLLDELAEKFVAE